MNIGVTHFAATSSEYQTMTRRTAILTSLGLPLWAYAPKLWAYAPREFWNEKKPEDWTDEERQQLLTKSPWAQEPKTQYNSGPGGLPAGRGSATRGGRVVGGSRTTTSGSTNNPGVPQKYQSIVRWESALPIREANHNKSKDDPAANYILKVLGDLPMLSLASNDETEAEYAQRLDNLKQYTKLEKKGDPIYLSNLRHEGKGEEEGTLFYFVRNDLITLDDKAVTLVTKLGPIDVKCKFTLKDMMYQGKLEL